MDDRAFDRRMCEWAACEGDAPDSERLERVLATLPRRGEGRPRAARRRLALVLAAMLLVCATALAAQLGLSYFMDKNPYNFYRGGVEDAAPLNAQPLMVLDDAGLTGLRAAPIDSAWIEGRLTLTVRLSSGDARPLRAALLTQEGDRLFAEVYERDDQPPETCELPCDGLLLLVENIALYARRDGQDALSCAPEYLTWETQEDGVLLAVQCPPDFILASELDALTDEDGRIPLRLETYVRDGMKDRAESLLLSVAAPTEEEKEEMNP